MGLSLYKFIEKVKTARATNSKELRISLKEAEDMVLEISAKILSEDIITKKELDKTIENNNKMKLFPTKITGGKWGE